MLDVQFGLISLDVSGKYFNIYVHGGHFMILILNIYLQIWKTIAPKMLNILFELCWLYKFGEESLLPNMILSAILDAGT